MEGSSSSLLLSDEEETKSQQYLKTRDPLQEFFSLTCKSVKLASPHVDLITEVPEARLYQQVVKEGIPFYKWHSWVET